jgi:hypothetical protein
MAALHRLLYFELFIYTRLELRVLCFVEGDVEGDVKGDVGCRSGCPTGDEALGMHNLLVGLVRGALGWLLQGCASRPGGNRNFTRGAYGCAHRNVHSVRP